MLITLYANYQVASLLVCVWVVWFPKTMAARSLANSAFRTADAALGTALCAALIIICFIGEIGLVMVDKVQTLVQVRGGKRRHRGGGPGRDAALVGDGAGAC